MDNNNANSVYQSLLYKSLDTIKKQINSLESKNHGLRALTDKTTVEIEGLKLQYNEITQQLKQMEPRKELSEKKEQTLEKWDKKSDYIHQKEQKTAQSIIDYENLQQQLGTRRAKLKVAKKVEHKQQLIKLLQTTSNLIDKRQKLVMLPQYLKDKKRMNLLATQQAKINLTAAKIEDNKALQAMLDPTSSILDRVQAKIYDIKGTYYQKNLSHSLEVLNTMQQSKSNIAIRGANAITLGKKTIAKLREKQEMAKLATTQNSQQTNMASTGMTR